MRRPDLRRHEHVRPGDAGRANALTDFSLVVVHLRGIDMAAITETKRLLDNTRAGASAQLPRPEPNRRNARTICFNELHDPVL